MHLQALEKEQACLDTYQLSSGRHFVSAIFDLAQEALSVRAMEWCDTVDELVENATKRPCVHRLIVPALAQELWRGVKRGTHD